MSISYNSALKRTGKGQMGLVDSDDWLVNHSISKGPLTGKFTRQKDFVTDNSRITQAIADSADRFSESLLIFPRAVNPMVSIQFSNSDGKPAKLPHTILRDGAFRPPIRTLLERTPWSRLPFGAMSINSTPVNLFSDNVPMIEGRSVYRENKPILLMNVDQNVQPPAKQAPKKISFNRLIEKISAGSVQPNASNKFTLTEIYNQIPQLREIVSKAIASNMSNEHVAQEIERKCPRLKALLTSAVFPNMSNDQVNVEFLRQLPRLKDLISVAVASNMSNDQIIIEMDRHFPHLRSLPNCSAQSNISDDQIVIEMDRNLPQLRQLLEGSSQSNPSNDQIVIDMERQFPHLKESLDISIKSNTSNENMLVIEMVKNIPRLKNLLNYSTRSNMTNDQVVKEIIRLFPTLRTQLTTHIEPKRSSGDIVDTNLERCIPKLRELLNVSAETNMTDDHTALELIHRIPELKNIMQFSVETSPQNGYISGNESISSKKLKDRELAHEIMTPATMVKYKLDHVSPILKGNSSPGEYTPNVGKFGHLMDNAIHFVPKKSLLTSVSSKS